jgi:restriction system protein
MIKRDGTWYITDEGRNALKTFPTYDELDTAAAREYQAWRKARATIESEDIAAEELDLGGQLAQLHEITLEDARDRSRQSIRDHVKSLDPFEFQDMVAALLKAMGYYISSKANPGKDWGIDLVAYKDPLGAELPRLKVQVKHTEAQIGRPEIQKFVGAIGHDDIGIFVSSGGFSSDARDAVRSHATAKVTLVDFDDMLALWTRFYETIDESDKRFLRLEPVYFLASAE